MPSQTPTTAKLADEAALLTSPSAAHAKLPAQPHRTLPSSNTSGRVQKTRWTEREAQRARMDAVKAKERAMKQEKDEAARARREQQAERKKKHEERARLDAMAQKMSAKKLDRKRRRLGLTKKVSH